MHADAPTGAAFDWLARRAMLSPEAVALHDPERGDRISYREWNRRAERAAGVLAAAGVERGDRIAVLAENAVEVLDLLFACNKLGALFAPLNWRLADRELKEILDHAAPRLLLADAALDERAAQLGGALSRMHLAELAVGPARGPAASPGLSSGDPWILCYTGGSSGTPKGVVQTYGSVLANAVNTLTGWGLGPGDTAILDAPLFHTGALHVFTTPLVLAGGASIVCPRFDPDRVFDRIASGVPTLYFGVPTMLLRLVEHRRWDEADMGRLRLVMSGGAPTPGRLFEAFFARGVPLRAGYGLTEAGPNNFWLPAELVSRKPGSVGVPLLQVEVRLEGEDGREVTAPDALGEVLLRGPHLMAGYYGEPALTREALTGDGWLRTGDLARRDADGAFWIVGRRKEMFISGGENVYPAEIEDALHDHPAVAEAAVVAAPHPAWGEVGIGFVVARPGESTDTAVLRHFLGERLARYKLPRHLELVAELPRTGAGKIDRQALRRAAESIPLA